VLFVLGPLLVLGTAILVWLCYTWMQSTRASQRRTEAQTQRVIELLQEQNQLLRDLRER
jgi:type II secretory pathway component PulJ